jgi:hypothetical protein
LIVPYDAEKDFDPLTVVGFIPHILVVRDDYPAKTLAEPVARGKAMPIRQLRFVGQWHLRTSGGRAICGPGRLAGHARAVSRRRKRPGGACMAKSARRSAATKARPIWRPGHRPRRHAAAGAR